MPNPNGCVRDKMTIDGRLPNPNRRMRKMNPNGRVRELN